MNMERDLYKEDEESDNSLRQLAHFVEEMTEEELLTIDLEPEMKKLIEGLDRQIKVRQDTKAVLQIAMAKFRIQSKHKERVENLQNEIHSLRERFNKIYQLVMELIGEDEGEDLEKFK